MVGNLRHCQSNPIMFTDNVEKIVADKIFGIVLGTAVVALT